MKAINLVGRVFGRLEVLPRAGRTSPVSRWSRHGGRQGDDEQRAEHLELGSAAAARPGGSAGPGAGGSVQPSMRRSSVMVEVGAGLM